MVVLGNLCLLSLSFTIRIVINMLAVSQITTTLTHYFRAINLLKYSFTSSLICYDITAIVFGIALDFFARLLLAPSPTHQISASRCLTASLWSHQACNQHLNTMTGDKESQLVNLIERDQCKNESAQQLTIDTTAASMRLRGLTRPVISI
jgi:hypothetical protein